MGEKNVKLKFLFVSSDTFPPKRVDVAVLFGEKIAERGHHIDWVLQSETACNNSYQTEWRNCTVWVGKTNTGITRISRLKKHIYGIKHDLIIFKLIKYSDYDFIQVKDKFISAIFGLILARIKKIKFIYWLSYPFPESSLYEYKEGIARYPLFYFIRGNIFSILLYKIILPMSTHVFVQSEQMKLDIAAKNINADKITPVPMGISLKDFENVNKIDLNHNKSPIVVYLGTLARVRRIDFLIRVIKEVKRKFSNVKLYLVGDGEGPIDREVIYQEADKLGVRSNVSITGFLPRNDALQFVASAHVCVSPFFPTPILNSTSPTKLIEYMAMGRPVVANDHPEQRQIINESGAGICVPYNEDAFASAIIQIFDNQPEAERMGVKGRTYVEKFREYNAISRSLEQKYYQICESS